MGVLLLLLLQVCRCPTPSCRSAAVAVERATQPQPSIKGFAVNPIMHPLWHGPVSFAAAPVQQLLHHNSSSSITLGTSRIAAAELMR